jgi:hypothetical protein
MPMLTPDTTRATISPAVAGHVRNSTPEAMFGYRDI